MNNYKKLSHTPGKENSAASLENTLEAFNHPELLCAVGEQLLKEGRPEVARDFFKKAVEIDANSVHGWFGQGIATTKMEEYAESLEYFRTAIKLDPKLAIAQHNLGRSLHEIGQADLAYQSFQQSINLGFVATRKDVAISIPGCPSASHQTVLMERKQWADELKRSGDIKPGTHAINRDKEKQCLNIGYVSAFFHKENWMKPVWGLLAQHDRDKFQIHLLSDRTKLLPAIKKHLHPGDQFHDLSKLSNEDVANLITRLNIDILVDLNGYSYPQRFPVFVRRPAPLIVGWFNLYATTGFSCFDYLIGDDCVIPQNEEPFYTEKIARVEGSYLTFTVGYDVPDVVESPCIANGFVTFGSLISQYKITDKVIDAWSEILNQTPDSRLLIRNACLGKDSNQTYLRAQFEDRGIDAQRINLEGPAPHFEFLETYNRIDIALDAYPYNGGTTTTEAIWQGVPVVSFWGDRWVSRTSATLLRSAGLDELVAKDAEDYIRLATQLARDFESLENNRQNLRAKLVESKACDTVSFARSMETLYREIWAK